ncbi:MAG TPA: acyltransferase family protein [Mycobacteriales bacterium]|nr:acyltransferase family protein [Mycobacteriales bacterium]
MTTRQTRIGYIPGLDGVRGLAVLSVILFHLGLVLSKHPHAPGWLVHVGPFVLGVQAFFVLSGALITSLLVSERRRTATVSFRGFYLRRWRRLGPALVVLVPLLIVAQLLWTGSSVGSPLGTHPLLVVVSVALFVGNWANFRGDSNLAWMGPAWSLGVEEQFYLTWPAVLMVCMRRRVSRRNLYLGLGFAVVLSVATAALIQHHYGLTPTYFATPTQLPCILLGCALGFELTVNPAGRLARLLRRRVVAIAGILGALVSGLEIVDHTSYQYRGGYLPFSVCVCLVVGHCFVSVDRQSVVTRALSWRPLDAIGKISYELYLVNLIVIAAVSAAAPNLPVYPTMLVDVVLTFAGSAALYAVFDHRVRRFGWLATLRLSGRIPAPRLPQPAVYPARARAGWLAGAAVAATAVVVAGAMVVTEGGSHGGDSKVVIGAAPVVSSVIPQRHSTAPSASVAPGGSGERPVTRALGPRSATSGRSGTAASTSRQHRSSSRASTPTRLPVPTVQGVSPLSGPLDGGTDVTVIGTGFVPGAKVYFGTVAAKDVRVVNATTLKVLAPSAGKVALGTPNIRSLYGLTAPIVVSTGGGRSAATGAVFTYL